MCHLLFSSFDFSFHVEQRNLKMNLVIMKYPLKSLLPQKLEEEKGKVPHKEKWYDQALDTYDEI